MEITNSQLNILDFFYMIEHMGGTSLFDLSYIEEDDDFLKILFDAFYAVHGHSLALCHSIKEGNAVATASGEEAIHRAFEIFCRRFNLDENQVSGFSEEETIRLLNNLFTFTGNREELDRPKLEPEYVKLLDIFPLSRSGFEYREYRLKK
jgi:hypothetical protein